MKRKPLARWTTVGVAATTIRALALQLSALFVVAAVSASLAANCNAAAASVAQTPAQGPPYETHQEGEERLKHPGTQAPERMAIAKVPEDVPIAIPLRLRVTMAPGKLINTNLFGSIYVTEIGPSGEGVQQGTGKAKIISDDGTTKVIEVMPAQLGKVTITLNSLYSDNAEAVQTIHVNVYPTAKGLEHFSLGVGRRLDLALDGERQGERWLRPRLTYSTLDLYANGADTIKLTVDQPEDDPVIRLDKNGLIHPLRAGKAIIIGDIEGVQDRVEVAVYRTNAEVPLLARPSHR